MKFLTYITFSCLLLAPAATSVTVHATTIAQEAEQQQLTLIALGLAGALSRFEVGSNDQKTAVQDFAKACADINFIITNPKSLKLLREVEIIPQDSQRPEPIVCKAWNWMINIDRN